MILKEIFGLGLAILSSAIVFNYLATLIGLKTWYDFLQQPEDTGLVSIFWLFAVYPFSIGVVAHYVSKMQRN